MEKLVRARRAERLSCQFQRRKWISQRGAYEQQPSARTGLTLCPDCPAAACLGISTTTFQKTEEKRLKDISIPADGRF